MRVYKTLSDLESVMFLTDIILCWCKPINMDSWCEWISDTTDDLLMPNQKKEGLQLDLNGV